MLSDEEKKAIERIEKLVEYLKKWNKNFTVVPEDVKYFEKILDMTKTHIRMIDENIEEILEQSKEIEELKEKNRQSKMRIVQLENEITARIEDVNQYYTPNDKIKAKIEELERQEKEESDAFLCKRVLQSLLRKDFPTTITKEELEKRWKE